MMMMIMLMIHGDENIDDDNDDDSSLKILFITGSRRNKLWNGCQGNTSKGMRRRSIYPRRPCTAGNPLWDCKVCKYCNMLKTVKQTFKSLLHNC